jgi:hypothetical protein
MNKSDHLKSIHEINHDKWLKLSHKKIYFGHMSVGYNIISGLKKVIEQNQAIELKIIEIDNDQISPLSDPVFAHSRLGGNEDPKSKIDAFVALMKNGMANNVDIAFFKLCYMDINQATNINGLFAYYKSSMQELSEKFPETIFAHVTTPLTSRQTGLKALIKKMIGRQLRGYNNTVREQFNEMMRNEYAQAGKLFDLALIEATCPDMNQENCQTTNKESLSLQPVYTEDGSHLNAFGSKIVAEQLLISLAALVL